MAAKMTLLLVLVLSITTTVIGQLVLVNEPLEVAIGRTVVLDERVLAIQSPGEDEQCKVEVAVDEPFYQRVGTLEPQVFDCEFFPGSIRYIHSGSPLLDHDIIKLRVYMLTGTDTIKETFYLYVNVTQEQYRVIRPMMYIEVDEFNGISDPIDMRILDFDFNRSSPGASCFVRINTLTSSLPRYGELIRGEGNETREVRALYENCDDFLYLNIRYRHILPPSPNVDYIELTIEVEDSGKYDRPFVERFQLMVNIDPAFENQNPTEAFLAQYIMDVDQFILTTITTDVMSGTDDETTPNKLFFHVSKPPGPGEGSIVHLDDQSRPIESFSQAELRRYNIAYKPPDRSYPDVRLIEIEFEVYDEYFAKSEPITLTVAVHPTETNAPRVSVNRGLTLLEGQSRPIHPQNFEVVDNDNINMVRIKVVGGPHHGRLLLNNRPMIMFTPRDIEAGAVVYRHDDSDTLKDSIELRITDMSHTVHTSFPINILPSDDSAPSLIRNIHLSVDEGQTVRITRFDLLASDKDSNDNYIVYRIINPPSAGEILKKYSTDSFGYPVTDFTQRDLFRGMIYYHHLGREQFMDNFEIVLLDNHIPPNVSPTQTVLIFILPVHDRPPEIVAGVTSSITVKETDIGYITREHLQYTDSELEDSDQLRYTITTPPYVIATHSLTDAGRIFSTIGVVMPMKDPTIQGVRTFKQQDIDHHTIAYMPPFKEIGPNPREIRFVYSVSDKHGNNPVLGQFFDITVLPVNNQAPVIFANNLMVPEGGILIVQAMHFTITDMDTDTADLVITLDSLPEYGQLVVGNVNLTEGGTFSVGDINAGRVRYIHGGSEVPRDDFTLSVSDGVHSATRDVIVSVTPVNDQIPIILPGLVTHLTIAEGGEIAITSDIIAATDVDTNDMLLHFITVQHPKRGVVLRNGIIANRFTQLDVKQGSISYVHMGGETGKVSVFDSVTFVVSDKSIPSAANLPVHEINITITPVDNQAPGIVFGNPFLVNEGDQAPLTLAVLSAIDRDSNLDQLTFHIVGQPDWGLVENILPSPGYEKSNAGKPIIFFTYQDIIDGNINYVQTIHSQVEPMSDSFILYVSDGKHPSPNVSFIINIIPVNDEIPILTVRNFSVFENSFFKLNTDYIIASDLDIPMEMLMFSVVKSPRHGSLVDWALPLESRFPVFDFNLNQLLNTLRLTYVHDGSESTSDNFAIRVTDGKHTIQKSIYVTIISVNDEPPEIIKNTGVTVDIHESRVISPVLLLAQDEDTPADGLYFTIVTLPKRGVLQRKPSADVWIDITALNSNFTQEELNSNVIRYLHSSDLGSKGLDRFRFVVTDGVHSTGKESFRIDITNTKREPLQLINTGAEVFEGEFVIIAPECLAAFDNGYNLAEIFFTINVPPSEGQIEDLSRPGVPISSFSQLNIVGQRVIYVHKRTDRIRNDNFMFSVTNGYQTRNDTFHIVVIPVDNELPALIINKPLEIPEGGSDFIKPAHLEAIDQDTPPHGVTFIIVQPPQYGALYLGGVPVSDRFTQFDLNNYDISYNQLVPGAESDGFYFVVTDNTNVGFTVRNSPQSQPVRFTINIDHMDSQPPRLITNIIPIKMENRNRRYGFIFGQQVLYSEDECPPEGITYMITREPVHGHLENLAKRQRVQGQFTQQDVNDRSIMYIMKEETKVTNDSFLFSVYDCNGNALMGQKFELKWPMIQFMRADYMVCETVGTLQINIMRVGYLSLSSFVDIEVSDLTATSGEDYAPPRARQLQFDPGVAMATWDVAIVEDQLEENRERFRLKLATSVNAVLGEHDKLTVVIKDSKDGSCSGENHGLTITDTLPSCCLEGVMIQPNPRPLCCQDQGPIYPDTPHLGPIIPQRNPSVPGEDAFNPVYPVKPGDGIPVGHPDVPGPYPVPEGYIPQGGQYEGGFVPGNPDPGYVYPGGDAGFIPDGECCPPDHVPGQGETGYPYPQQPDQGHGVPHQPDTRFDQQGQGVYPQDAGVYTQHQQGQGVVPDQQYPSVPNGQWNPYYTGQPRPDTPPGGGTGTNPGEVHPSQTGSQGHPVWPYYTKDGQPYIPDQFANPAPATDSQGRPYPIPERPYYQQGQGPISQGPDGDSHAVPQYPTHQGQNPQFQPSWPTHQAENPQYPAQNPYQDPGGSNPHVQGGIADNPQQNPYYPQPGLDNSRDRTHYSGRDPNPNPSRPDVPGRVSNGQHILSRPSGRNGSTTVWTLHGIASSPTVVHGRTSSSSSSSSAHHQPLPSSSQRAPDIPPDDGHLPAEALVNPDQWQVSTAEHQGRATSEPTQPVQTPSDCTTTSKDDFIMEEDTGTLYKCDGNRWIRVEWSHVQADEATNQETGCGEGWLELDGMCYFISTEAQTWNNAQRSCRERYHGNLVTISTSKIYNWIRSVSERRELWIGLNDKHTSDQWEWVSGTPVTFTRWKVGSPMPGNRSDRNCASYNNHARWNEKKCSKNKHLYMCEKQL